jgi:hypothetical protein
LIGATVLIASAVLFGMRSCQGEVTDVGGVKVLVAGHQGSGMDALGGGTLEVVDGCLGASGDVYVFPQGTDVVDEDPLTVDIPGVGEVALGEELVIGGGWVLEHPSDQVPSGGTFDVADVTVPARCAEHDVFLSSPDQ